MIALAVLPVFAIAGAPASAKAPKKINVGAAYKAALAYAESAYNNNDDADDYGVDRSSCHRTSRRTVQCLSYLEISVYDEITDLSIDSECDWLGVVTQRRSGKLSVARRDLGCTVI